MTRARRAAEQRGRWAEWAALAWLLAKGYRPLAHRTRTPAGELDLVMRQGAGIIVVEVKARPTLEAGLEAVSSTARRRIIKAAALWRARRPALAACPARFDLVIIRPWRPPVHVRNAWTAEGEDVHLL